MFEVLTALRLNAFATLRLNMQVLGLLGKYLSVRREVFPHMLHVKLASVSLRAGSFFVPAMYGFERKGRGATESPHVHWLKIRPSR